MKEARSDRLLKAAEPEVSKGPEFKLKYIQENVILFGYLHLAAIYGVYLFFFHAKWATVIFTLILHNISSVGAMAGSHRLWSHRAYKANLPLRILLAIMQTTSFENHIFQWARDHRIHHKFSDTDADPYNANRGFFYSHAGCHLTRKHPKVFEKRLQLDLSDLYADKVVMFQKKYYFQLMPFACFIIPTLIPMYCWGESFSCSWYCAGVLRYILTLNGSSLINSAAHMWGYRPYDKNINPAENIAVSIASAGEGWHNYHHTFPWDYKAAELAQYSINLSTAFIDFMAIIGWAHDLKTVPQEIIRHRTLRTGDGSHDVWGWGDKDIEQEMLDNTQTILEKK